MRQSGVLYYIFGDHLGSTAVVKNTQGGKTELRYTAWWTTRYEYGTTPTDRRYTGQREEASLGLYFYNARWYDPALGRFIQADSIVPSAGNPQAWDRYAYVNNDPVNYTDPSGNKACIDFDKNGECIVDPDWLLKKTIVGGNIGSGNNSKYGSQPLWKVELGNDTLLIWMPPGSNPTMSRPEWAKRLGMGLSIAAFSFDIGELVGIFIPEIGGEDITALGDVSVTYVASLLLGQSYLFEQPHPGIPIMISVNQDVLVTAGDAVIAMGAKAVGGIVGGSVGYSAGLITDVFTTGASLIYNYNRVFGSLPNYITIGLSVSPESFGHAVIVIWP